MAPRPRTPTIDGRHLRSGRTRGRLVDAYLELVEGGEPRPRGTSVADRAGVSLRTLYHHFERLGDLAAIALRSGSTSHLAAMRAVGADGSREGRIEALVRARGELFDAAAGIGEATVAEGQPTRALEGVRSARSVLRRQIECSFAVELATSGPAQRQLLDALDAVSSADAWAYLRSELGRSATDARGVVAGALSSLLSACPAESCRQATSG